MSKLTIQPELKFRFDYMRVFQIFWFEQTELGFSARAELRPGLNPLPCNRQFDFKRICLRSRVEISARVEIRHVIGPLVVISAIYTIEKKIAVHKDKNDGARFRILSCVNETEWQ